MSENKDTRKLRAILHADVKGYSRLMGEDESYTVRTLTECRKIFSDTIKKHAGRVVNAPGDSILSEFPSIVLAVQCAVEIQEQLLVKNASLSENRQMLFRIGINLGDVIQKEGAIYGDGVNIAARIEALAEPGGVCVSRNAYEHIKNKLNLGYEYIGEHDVKNIKDPVSVYKLLVDPSDAGKILGEKPKKSTRKWVLPAIVAMTIILTLIGYQVFKSITAPDFEPASVDRMALRLPVKPSIAVLPFDNMSKRPDEEYFGDGLADDIITALSKSSEIFVVGRNSTFTYKGVPVNVPKVAEELGVRYVLEGSFRKESNKVRINVQLIDAIKGYHIWSENYDKELENIFVIQDQITKKIISSLHVQLTIGEDARIVEKGTKSLKAYLLYLRARELHFQFSKDENHRARKLLEEIISIDPEYGPAYSLLAATHMVDIFIQATDSPKQSLKTAIDLARKSKNYWDGSHDLLGFLYSMVGQFDNALIECKKSVDLYPSSSTAHTFYGVVLNAVGRHEEAIAELERSARLDPFTSSFSLRSLCLAYALAGRYDDAIKVGRKAVDKSQNDLLANFFLTLSYSLAGRIKEAQNGSKEILRINPSFSLESFVKRLAIRNPNQKKLIKDSLQKAGLPLNAEATEPDKPSIAVLPFDNMSGDPEQEYFSDGLTDQIISTLSKIRGLFVIARNSTFTYKGEPVKIQRVAEELGVKFVLEGSVQKSADRIRITAQLIDATTGHHVWSERYDRELKEIFDIQDDITLKVTKALEVELIEGEQARIWQKDQTSNLEAYEKFLQGHKYHWTSTKEGTARARALFQEAIALDPGYSAAYTYLGWTHWSDARFGWSASRTESIKKAFAYAQKALQLNAEYPYALILMGILNLLQGQHEKSIELIESALAIEPNSADYHTYLAGALGCAGRWAEGIGYSEISIRMSPRPSVGYYWILGRAYFMTGQYNKAVETFKKSVQINPDHLISHAFLAACYSSLNRQEEAATETDEVLRINPKFTLESYAKTLPYKNRSDIELYISALRKAGLPE